MKRIRSLNPANELDREVLLNEDHVCRYSPPTYDELAADMLGEANEAKQAGAPPDGLRKQGE